MLSNHDINFLVAIISVSAIGILYGLLFVLPEKIKLDRIEALRERAKSIYIGLQIPHVSGYGEEHQEILLKLEKEIETLEDAVHNM